MIDYTNRFYRDWTRSSGLQRFEIKIEQSDLLVLCDRDLREAALGELGRVRRDLETYMGDHPAFLTSLEPCAVEAGAPAVVRAMAEAASRWHVGPMAAVAGAIAQAVGLRLLEQCAVAFVENGGDVFVKSDRPARFALYAGERSPFSDRVAFEVDASMGVGVCTSSGVVGPSLSLGRADAVVALARGAAEADAAATAVANLIQAPGDVDRVVSDEEHRGRLRGLIACAGDRIGFWGDIEIGSLKSAGMDAVRAGPERRPAAARRT